MCGLCFLYNKLWEDLSVNSYLITIEEALVFLLASHNPLYQPLSKKSLTVRFPLSFEISGTVTCLSGAKRHFLPCE